MKNDLVIFTKNFLKKNLNNEQYKETIKLMFEEGKYTKRAHLTKFGNALICCVEISIGITTLKLLSEQLKNLKEIEKVS